MVFLRAWGYELLRSYARLALLRTMSAQNFAIAASWKLFNETTQCQWYRNVSGDLKRIPVAESANSTSISKSRANTYYSDGNPGPGFMARH